MGTSNSSFIIKYDNEEPPLIRLQSICFASLISTSDKCSVIIETEKLSFNENINEEDLYFIHSFSQTLGIETELKKIKNDYYLTFKKNYSGLKKRFFCILIRILYEGYNFPNYDNFFNIYLDFKILYRLFPKEDMFKLLCIANNITFANNQTKGLKKTSFLFNTNHTFGTPYMKIMKTLEVREFLKNGDHFSVNTNFALKSDDVSIFELKDNSDESYINVYNLINNNLSEKI